MYMQTQTFNISFPDELVVKMDRVAKQEYRNRSELIREAVRMYLGKLERWDLVFEYGRKAAKRAGIKSEEEVNRLVEEYRHGRKKD